jgi:hypothetical protein
MTEDDPKTKPPKSQRGKVTPIAVARKKRASPKLYTKENQHELIAEFNKTYAVACMGAKAVIVRKQYDQLRHRDCLEYLTKEDLELLYENCRVQTDTGKTISAALYWRRHPERRQFQQIIFAPGQDFPEHLNLWRGFSIEPKPGDWSLLRHHIEENVCSKRERETKYLFALMADSVQKLTERPGIVLVLRGKEGTGKGVFLRWWKAIFGQHGLQISHPKHLTGNFNGHLQDCLFLYVDEGFWAGDQKGEGTLKNLISEPEIVIERKGKDAYSTTNYLHIAMSSNEAWVVPAGPEARRYFVLDVAERERNNHDYFAAIEQQMKNGGLEAMLYDLLHQQLDGVRLREVPQTQELLEQKLLSLSAVPRFWYGRLLDGGLAPGRDWIEYTPSREVYTRYLEETKDVGDRRRSVETFFYQELKALCPGIEKKKTTVDIHLNDFRGPNTKREQLWCFRCPPLADCRLAFEKFLSQPITWPTD